MKDLSKIFPETFWNEKLIFFIIQNITGIDVGDYVFNYVEAEDGTYSSDPQGWIGGNGMTVRGFVHSVSGFDPEVPNGIRNGYYYGEEVKLGVYKDEKFYKVKVNEFKTANPNPTPENPDIWTVDELPMKVAPTQIFIVTDAELGDEFNPTFDRVPYLGWYYSQCPQFYENVASNLWDENLNVIPSVGYEVLLRVGNVLFEDGLEWEILEGTGKLDENKYKLSLEDIQKGYFKFRVKATLLKEATCESPYRDYTVEFPKLESEPIHPNLDYIRYQQYIKGYLNIGKTDQGIHIATNWNLQTREKYNVPAVLVYARGLKKGYQKPTNTGIVQFYRKAFTNGNITELIEIPDNIQKDTVVLYFESIFLEGIGTYAKYSYNQLEDYVEQELPSLSEVNIIGCEFEHELLVEDDYLKVGLKPIQQGKNWLAIGNKADQQVIVKLFEGNTLLSARGIKAGQADQLPVYWLEDYLDKTLRLEYHYAHKFGVEDNIEFTYSLPEPQTQGDMIIENDIMTLSKVGEKTYEIVNKSDKHLIIRFVKESGKGTILGTAVYAKQKKQVSLRYDGTCNVMFKQFGDQEYSIEEIEL